MLLQKAYEKTVIKTVFFYFRGKSHDKNYREKNYSGV